MVFDKVNHLSSSHLHILSFSRMFNQNCIILFQRGNSYIIGVLELIWLRRMFCFTCVWSRCDGCDDTPTSSPSNFTREGRDPCGFASLDAEFLFDIWEYLHHITPQRIRIIYDSGAVFFLVLALLFLRRQSDCSNQPTARVVGAHVWLFVWHTVSYGYDWRECCQHRVSKRFPICC